MSADVASTLEETRFFTKIDKHGSFKYRIWNFSAVMHSKYVLCTGWLFFLLIKFYYLSKEKEKKNLVQSFLMWPSWKEKNRRNCKGQELSVMRTKFMFVSSFIPVVVFRGV